MASLHELNHWAKHAIDFEFFSFERSRLLVIGSFDLCYYHDIELAFVEVSYIRCPTSFSWPCFKDCGKVEEGHRFTICADEGEFEIVAERLDISIGKVYHYDRGDDLQPGERIADWVVRKKAQQGGGANPDASGLRSI